MLYDNPWMYDGSPLLELPDKKYIAFVYEITNKTNGRRYIGKKLFHMTRTKQVKKKKKRVKVESDWRDYYGSNKELQADVAKLGAENFDRRILKLCESKGTANYWEMKHQILNEVLESDQWYNDWIMVKVHRSHIKS
jgi:hypothetical protein